MESLILPVTLLRAVTRFSVLRNPEQLFGEPFEQ